MGFHKVFYQLYNYLEKDKIKIYSLHHTALFLFLYFFLETFFRSVIQVSVLDLVWETKELSNSFERVIRACPFWLLL